MLKVQFLHPLATLPTVAHPGEDLGYDLYALEYALLELGNVTKIRTGIAACFESPVYNFGLLIRDRSSMAAKGIVTSAGVIDAGYRGEIIVLLTNTGGEAREIKPGEKIAQMIPIRVRTRYGVESVSELPEALRGAKGFGSSGN